MNLRQIRYAVAVAETGHFTRAAALCHTVQSALSHQIARLEEELGSPLFARNSRNVTLTPAGQAFLDGARQLLQAEEQIRNDVAAVSGAVRGSLHIGAISTISFDLPALLARFHRRYPEVTIRLTHAGSDVLQAQVRAQQCDIAFLGLRQRIRPDIPQHLLLGEETLVGVVPRDHPLTRQAAVDLADLAGWPMADFESGCGARLQSDEAFDAAGITRNVPFEVGHGDHIGPLVRQGLAVALLPPPTARQIHDVIVLPIRDAPRRRTWCCWSSHPSAASRAFIDLLRQEAHLQEPAAG